MKINLHVPDELFETYVNKHGIPGCYGQMKTAIEVFKDFDKHDRYLVIYGDARRAIEATFQTTMDTPDKLVKAVKNLNMLKIEGAEINFTVDELARIDAQAVFHGLDREAFMLKMAREIKDYMLEQV